MSYDKTFCTFYLLCKDGYKCDRALTKQIEEDIKEKKIQVSVYATFPDCFKRFFEP